MIGIGGDIHRLSGASGWNGIFVNIKFNQHCFGYNRFNIPAGRVWLLRRNKTAFLPQSPINKAVQHTLKIRRSLTRYTRDGRLPIDNNLAENAIRPVALGRKNWLFLGSEIGGETAAILMTFTTTCRKLKINTWEYLSDVLKRINTHPMSKIDDLLPDRWQQLRRA